MNDHIDHAFRQTGLHDNEEEFSYYGEWFEPELSNLRIVTTGVSWPLFENGLLAIAHHRYWQTELATTLRDAETSPNPNGKDKSLGREWDVIVEFDI